MANNKKKKEESMMWFIVIIVLLLFAIIGNSIFNKKDKKISIDVSNKTEQVENVQEEQTNENKEIIAKLKKMKERDRMEFYFSTFLSYVEDGEYEKAYDLLNEDYKSNYFPTIEDFETYVDKKFSDMTSIKHDNIERIGDMYVLWIYISDAINGKPNEEEEMKIVIKENDFFDFEMSFSII